MARFPKHTGGGWYELSSGEKVQGKAAAIEAEADLGGGKKTTQAFTDAERAAIKERARELKAESGGGSGKAAGERDLLAKIAEMSGLDREMAERIHAIITTIAPELTPKTWYGMPAYAKDGKVVCFFQAAGKFDSRYATLGFNDTANLDTGAMWPTAFALVDLTAKEEATIADLVKRAVS